MGGWEREVEFRISTVDWALVTEVFYGFNQSTQEIPGYVLKLV